MNRNIDLSKTDLNIVKALKEIKWPLKNNDGVSVYLNDDRIDHISVKRHFLKIRDIKIINKILLKPIKVVMKDYRKKKVYFGRRRGSSGNDKHPYIEIVTVIKNGSEYIWTIYPRKTTDEKIPF